MSIFGGLFGNEKKSESVVLVDIGADSVAGAYANARDGEIPVLLYTRRLPVEVRKGEPAQTAMQRALTMLVEALVREGAPALMRATGSGTSSSILVSINAPWQKTSVRTELIEEARPFVFTERRVKETLKKTAPVEPGTMLVDESIIGTILNGYETRVPYGMEVHRAALVILTSLIDEKVAKEVITTLRLSYHQQHVLPIAGSSLRYQAVQRAFPHESDALIIDASGPSTSIALLRKGLFVSIVDVPGTDVGAAWAGHVENGLAEIGKQYPLPRTIFLLAREPDVSLLQKTLDTANLAKLWLSVNPPRMIPVLPSHIVGLVRQVSDAPPDILLLLMALYWRKSASDQVTSAQAGDVA